MPLQRLQRHMLTLMDTSSPVAIRTYYVILAFIEAVLRTRRGRINKGKRSHQLAS